MQLYRLGHLDKPALASHDSESRSSHFVLFRSLGGGGGERLVSEPLEIRIEERALNWENRLRLSSLWLSFLKLIIPQGDN